MAQKTFWMKTDNKIKSFKTVQARYKKKFHFNTFPNTTQIFKLINNFEAHSICEDHRVTGSSISGPPITLEECGIHYQLLCMPHSTVPSIEQWTFGASTLELLLTFLVPV